MTHHPFQSADHELVLVQPFAHSGAPLSALDGLSADQVVALFTPDLHPPVPVSSLTLLWVSASQELAGSPRTLRRLIDRVGAAERTVMQLLVEYRTTYEPFREGSLLRSVLPEWAAEIPVTVQASGPLDEPLNPWFLLREGDEGGAAERLLVALGWDACFAAQARAILHDLR